MKSMKRSLLVAALLLFGLGACGDKPAPTAPPPAAKAPEAAPPAAPTPPAPAQQAAPTPPPAPAPTAPAAPVTLQAGVHYQLIDPAQPSESGKPIEVVEFFWYACPHCNNLQPPLREWLKRKPADVEFRRIPAVLQDSWLQLARTFYAVDAMGLTDKLHHDIFTAIHEQKTLDPKALHRDPKPLFDWVAAKGVDRQKFADTYNSFAVTNRTQRAIDLTRNYDVPYTPVLVVNGRFLTSPSMKGNGNPDGSLNYERFFQNLDQLIAQARSGGPAGRPVAAK